MLKEKVIKAYNLSKELHEGQVRKYSNHPYFIHPKYTARIIEDLTNDEDLICVALLHDTLEDTEYTYASMIVDFGHKIADLVQEVTSNKPDQISKAQYLTNKMKNMSKEALLIKLADRWHNVKYLDKNAKTRQHLNFVKKYYLETVEIMNALNFTNKNSETKLLAKGIEFQLEYLRIKHRW